MHTIDILTNIVEQYQTLIYLFLFIGLLVEGEFVLIATGILLHIGALNFYFTLYFICLGLFCKTTLGYYLGRLIHSKWNHTKLLKYIEKRVLAVMPHFKRKPFWSIFISKFILGVNNIVIIFAGYQKINFEKYVKAEFTSTIVWAPALVSLGFFFSYAAFYMSQEIWRFSLIVLILTILFFSIDKLISWIYEMFEEFYHNNIQ